MLDCTFIEVTAAELATIMGIHRRVVDELLTYLRRHGHAQRIAYTIPRRGERIVAGMLAGGLGARGVVAKDDPVAAGAGSALSSIPTGNNVQGTTAEQGQGVLPNGFTIAPKGGRPPVLWRLPRTITLDLLAPPTVSKVGEPTNSESA